MGDKGTNTVAQYLCCGVGGVRWHRVLQREVGDMVNGGVIYVQNAHPQGPAVWALQELSRRVLRMTGGYIRTHARTYPCTRHATASQRPVRSAAVRYGRRAATGGSIKAHTPAGALIILERSAACNTRTTPLSIVHRHPCGVSHAGAYIPGSNVRRWW